MDKIIQRGRCTRQVPNRALPQKSYRSEVLPLTFIIYIIFHKFNFKPKRGPDVTSHYCWR